MVSNGHLWEFPLLGGIASALRLPMLTKVEIKEAAGNFMVKDKKTRRRSHIPFPSTPRMVFLKVVMNLRWVRHWYSIFLPILMKLELISITVWWIMK